MYSSLLFFIFTAGSFSILIRFTKPFSSFFIHFRHCLKLNSAEIMLSAFLSQLSPGPKSTVKIHLFNPHSGSGVESQINSLERRSYSINYHNSILCLDIYSKWVRIFTPLYGDVILKRSFETCGRKI